MWQRGIAKTAAAAMAANAGHAARTMASTAMAPTMTAPPVTRLSVAPMMDWTDRHYRFMMRLITKHTLLYTEMLVDQTLLHQQKNLDFFLGHDAVEAPLALQLGGNSVDDLSAAATLATAYGGYCEINLNTGCPSSLVSSRCFGARLMLDPERVHDICAGILQSLPAATASSSSPPPAVTVKCRIGVDNVDSYESLYQFIAIVARSGVTHFIVHARKCLLKGLSPHENRTVPPLKYDFVYRLKSDFPHLQFTLNGGVASIEHAKQLLDTNQIDGVMLGRAAYNTPWNLRDADRMIFGATANPNLSRREIIAAYITYAEQLQATWGDATPLGPLPYSMRTSTLIKPLMALFNGEYGSKAYKRAITANWATKEAPVPSFRSIIEAALKAVPDAILDARVSDERTQEHELEASAVVEEVAAIL